MSNINKKWSGRTHNDRVSRLFQANNKLFLVLETIKTKLNHFLDVKFMIFPIFFCLMGLPVSSHSWSPEGSLLDNAKIDF